MITGTSGAVRLRKEEPSASALASERRGLGREPPRLRERLEVE